MILDCLRVSRLPHVVMEEFYNHEYHKRSLSERLGSDISKEEVAEFSAFTGHACGS